MFTKAILAILLFPLLLIFCTEVDARNPPQTIIPSSEPDETKLKPGQFSWEPDRAAGGPVVIVVSLPDQFAYIYRNGILIGRTTVSTGKSGFSTPTGVFHILQKQREHVSDIYHASMPNTERLTWSGVALHAGGLPGYPSSHGCVHLPLELSSQLFDVTAIGTTVIITDSHFTMDTVEDPGLLTSLAENPQTQISAPLRETGLLWQPQLSPEGPISILISSVDKVILAYRNGILIGRSGIALGNPKQPLGYQVFTMMDGFEAGKSSLAPDEPAHKWMAVSMTSATGMPAYESLAQKVKIPPVFGDELYKILQPGTTLVTVDEPATAENTSAPDFRILTNGNPPGTK